MAALTNWLQKVYCYKNHKNLKILAKIKAKVTTITLLTIKWMLLSSFPLIIHSKVIVLSSMKSLKA